MEKVKVTRSQFQEIANEAWGKHFKRIENNEPTDSKSIWDEMDRYELYLDIPPVHANPDINALINRYCDDCRISDRTEGAIIYTGGQIGTVYCDTFGRPRIKLPESPEFRFIDEWCNGYREVFISLKDRVTLTLCEGDLSIVICPTEESFKAQLTGAIECYGPCEELKAI